jgi:hypothetical protein
MEAVLTRMESLNVLWTLDNLELFADWAEELQRTPSTTITGYRKRLVDCGARLVSLATIRPDPEPVPSPPRKSSRGQGKSTSAVGTTSAPAAGSLKPGDVFINAVKVVSFSYLSFRVLTLS